MVHAYAVRYTVVSRTCSFVLARSSGASRINQYQIIKQMSSEVGGVRFRSGLPWILYQCPITSDWREVYCSYVHVRTEMCARRDAECMRVM
jgi:hypothetical protein